MTSLYWFDIDKEKLNLQRDFEFLRFQKDESVIKYHDNIFFDEIFKNDKIVEFIFVIIPPRC